ncbi:class I glutamine amidotransferase-like protein [Xylaria cf. heliscus]|nr:class I glutamine amidotransferase-like protein [Xylaria cf. heliscus]
MAQPLNLAKPHRKIHVGVILMNSETEFIDIAPIDMIHGLSRHFVDAIPDELGPPGFKSGAIDMQFHWVSEAGPGTPARASSDLRIVPTDSFETCPPLDIVLVGANGFTYTMSAAELAFVRKSHASCSAFLAVCGGVDVLRAAGLLDGKTATGPRPLLPAWQADSSYGTTNWVTKRWVRDGKIWTSGALFNGCDMMSNFARQIWADTPTAFIIEYLSKLGAWPDRDIDYKDE